MTSGFGIGIRNFLSKKKSIMEIVHFGDYQVFEDASVYTCILTLGRESVSEFQYASANSTIIDGNGVKYNLPNSSLGVSSWSFSPPNEAKILKRISNQESTIGKSFDFVSAGVDTGEDDIFILEGKIIGDKFRAFSRRLNEIVDLDSEMVVPMLRGENVRRNSISKANEYVIYPYELSDQGSSPIAEELLKSKFQRTYNYLSIFKDEQIARKIRKKTNPKFWYSLHRGRNRTLFESKKIITPETAAKSEFAFDNFSKYHNTQVYCLSSQTLSKSMLMAITAVLNSQLFWFYISRKGSVLRGGYFRFKTSILEPFGLPRLSSNSMLELMEFTAQYEQASKEVLSYVSTFLRLLQRNFPALEKLSKKLQDWPSLDYAGFVKELNKALKKEKQPKLSLSQELEWESVFEAKRAEVLALRAEITQ